MKPVYQHTDGTFGAAGLLRRRAGSSSARGCSASTTASSADSFDVRVYLDPPEELRRHWKVQRDCSRRGYTTDQVLSELDRREPDSERSSARSATTPTSSSRSSRGEAEDQEHLDCKLTLLRLAAPPRPDGRRRRRRRRARADRAAGAQELYVPGRIPHERALGDRGGDLGEDALRPSHLREERLGEFTIGTDLHRSDSLAVVQLLILYHLVTARAKVALAGPEASARA